MQTFTLPLLPIRKTSSILFPGLYMNIDFGREKSINAIRDVADKDGHVVIAFQKNKEEEEPRKLWASGIEAMVKKITELPTVDVEKIRVKFYGIRRVTIKRVEHREGFNVVEFTKYNQEDGEISEKNADEFIKIQSMIFDMEGTMSFKPFIAPTGLEELSRYIDKLIYVSPIHNNSKLLLLVVYQFDPNKVH